MFDIRFDSTGHETDDQLVVGTIVLGSHKETFEACLCLWSRHDYERHWHHGSVQQSALVSRESGRCVGSRQPVRTCQFVRAD